MKGKGAQKIKMIIGQFIKKYNRFLGAVVVDGVVHDCHIPNTGRLKELLYEGNTVALKYVGHPNRKTQYEISLAFKDGRWYSIDSRVPNQLVKNWHFNGSIEKWAHSQLKAEKTFGQSRFDFQISGDLNGFIEVKGVTLERNGIGYFPDAPTERGRKHLSELIEVKKLGMYAAVVFVCQSASIESFHPNDETDPEFGKLLRLLRREGVDVLAFAANVQLEGIEFIGQIPVLLD